MTTDTIVMPCLPEPGCEAGKRNSENDFSPLVIYASENLLKPSSKVQMIPQTAAFKYTALDSPRSLLLTRTLQFSSLGQSHACYCSGRCCPIPLCGNRIRPFMPG